MSIIVIQSLPWEIRVECLLEVHKVHIERLLVLECFVHQYFEICDLVSCLPFLSLLSFISRVKTCGFCPPCISYLWVMSKLIYSSG